jgi:diguanylate cyclase (GGDEF)-like protein/PAS domain S-box-containing protein
MRVETFKDRGGIAVAKLHDILKNQYKKFLRDRTGTVGVLWRNFVRTVNEDLWLEEKKRLRLEQAAQFNEREIAKRNSHIRAIFETFPDIFFVTTEAGEIVEASGAALGEMGRPPSFWIGKTLSEFPNSEIGRRLQETLKHVQDSQIPVPFEFAFMLKGGLAFYEARLRSSGHGQTVVLIRDITARKTALEALKSSEERYALAARAANDGLWDWNLPTNRIYFSPRWKGLLGYADGEIENHANAWWDRIHPDDMELVKRTFTQLGEPGKDTLQIEYRIRHRDNSFRWVETRGLTVRDATGAAYRIVGSQTDISSRKEAEERLRHEGFHDKVTGLANRSLFMDRLTNVLDRVKRQPGYLVAVIYVDLDRFRAVNERVGHEAANRLLEAVAARLRSFARVGDTVARLGDDEFAILLDGIPNDRAAVIFADRMRDLITSPCDVGPEEIIVTASLGITLNNPESSSAESLLNEAESAMQRAKQAGKNCQELFSRENYSRLVSKLRIESELRHAAERGELELYYQPIFSIPDAKLIRLEALIRWNHPQRGMVSPLEFIPIAEETGLILNVGEWILHAVCDQSRTWHNGGRGPVGIAVNVSPRQFQQQNMLAQFGAALAKVAAYGFNLELEITEGAAMYDVDQSVKVLRSLRDMGVRISIDDFGVGYSSLSCLRLFPLNTLKIDRGFVQGVPKVKDNTAITNAIIGIAHSLGLSVVAEGVETEEQLQFLKDQGCEEAQGYLLGRPMPAKDIAPLLPKLT